MIDSVNWGRTLLECVLQSDQGVLVEAPNKIVTGFAGDKLTGMIQRLTKAIGKDYLEVGVFQGSSLLNTAYANPDLHCYGIDNYSQCDPSNQNRGIVIERAKALGVSNFTLIDKDFEVGLCEVEQEIGVYFIDGPHDYRSQLMCLGYGTRFLSKYGVMIVDDANYPHVRQATRDFVNLFPEYKLIFEAYTECHPANMSNDSRLAAKQGWWDGVHVIAHDPDNQFEGLECPAPSNLRFIRDHLIHGLRYAPVATEATLLLQSLFRPWQIPRAAYKTLRALRQCKAEIQGRKAVCETESANLQTRRSAIRAL